MSKKLLERVHNIILDNFREKGLTPINKTLLDGYFIFDFDKSAVMHFNLKEAPDWKFGVWLDYNKAEKPYTKDSKEDIDINIFAQHKLWIDKFKPSASSIEYETKMYLNPVRRKDGVVKWFDKKDLHSWIPLYEFEQIWKDKYLAFWRHMNGSLDTNYVSRFKAKIYYYKIVYDEWLSNKRNKKYLRKQIKLAHKFFKPLGYKYAIIDGNSDNLITSPRYTIELFLPKDILDNLKKDIEYKNKNSPFIIVENKWVQQVDGFRNRNKKFTYNYDSIARWITFKDSRDYKGE